MQQKDTLYYLSTYVYACMHACMHAYEYLRMRVRIFVSSIFHLILFACVRSPSSIQKFAGILIQIRACTTSSFCPTYQKRKSTSYNVGTFSRDQILNLTTFILIWPGQFFFSFLIIIICLAFIKSMSLE